jgi:DHA3 family macrolide efflux protein-like MFS transporter
MGFGFWPVPIFPTFSPGSKCQLIADFNLANNKCKDSEDLFMTKIAGNPTGQPTGMRGFVIVWLGQVVSMLGTGMTNFAISFWIFQQTGEATALTWALFFFMAPSVLFSPIAGAIVDRSNRKMVMIVSDLLAGVATIILLMLLAADSLQIWHIYLANLLAGAANAFQFPAYSAAVTMMLPKAQYGRAAGMLSLAGSASGILAPAFAGALLGPLGLVGIMGIDVATFLFAVFALFMVHIPQPEIAPEGRTGQGSLLQESAYGFRYIFERPSLLGLQMVFFLHQLPGHVWFCRYGAHDSGSHGQRRDCPGQRAVAGGDWRCGGRFAAEHLGRTPA